MIPFARIVKYGNVAPELGKIKDFQCTSDSSICNQYLLYRNGDLYGFGNNSGVLGDGGTTERTDWTLLYSNVKDIAVGGTNTVIRTNDDKILSTGNLFEMFPNKGYSETNTSFIDITNEFSSFNISTIKTLYMSQVNSTLFVIDENDKLFCTGSNAYYVSGKGTQTGSSLFGEVNNGDDVRIVRSSKYTTIVLKNDGTVWNCGTNTYRALGFGSNTSTRTSLSNIGVTGATAISTCEYTSEYVMGGYFYLAGTNGYSNGTGSSTTTFTTYTKSSQASLIPNYARIYDYVYGIGTQMYAWGDNALNMMGIGPGYTITSRPCKFVTTPVDFDVSKVSSLYVTTYATYFIYNNETLYASGPAFYTLMSTAAGVFDTMPVPG